MSKLTRQDNLNNARRIKNDEFYTLLSEVEKELGHYKKHFKDKWVFLNCNDDEDSMFWKYFYDNFDKFGLKRITAISFGDAIITDMGNSKVIERRKISGNGDFRSDESIEILKECDIVVTNPPFSLFREYINQLIGYDKKFIVVGSLNALSYKEIFPLIKENKVWCGYKAPGSQTLFNVPDDYKKFLLENKDDGSAYKIIDGEVYGRVSNVIWFTNIEIEKRHKMLNLTKKYTPEKYPKYDNYDAINVDKITDIPCDYFKPMGVPLTILSKYNPNQFEILGILQSSTDEEAGIPNLKYYYDFKEMRQDGSFTGAPGSKANGHPVVKGKPSKGNFLYNPQTDEYVHAVYARVVIRRKTPEWKKIDISTHITPEMVILHVELEHFVYSFTIEENLIRYNGDWDSNTVMGKFNRIYDMLQEDNIDDKYLMNEDRIMPFVFSMREAMKLNKALNNGNYIKYLRFYRYKNRFLVTNDFEPLDWKSFQKVSIKYEG